MAHRDAVRITTAPTSRAEDISARQRRYMISMAVRTLCFVGAVAVGPGWLRWVLVAGAVLLPYLSVVLANSQATRDDGYELRTLDHTRQLPPSDQGNTQGRPDHS